MSLVSSRSPQDEAFQIIGEKFAKVRAKGLRDESGFPRLAASFGRGGTPTQYMGTFPAFLAAWGPADLGYGAGQGVKCYHSEHVYGELWHRAFIVSPDTPRTNYVINCGNNVEASGGVVGIWREADARIQGTKRVQVEPLIFRSPVPSRPSGYRSSPKPMLRSCSA